MCDSLREERDRILEERICLQVEFDEFRSRAQEGEQRLKEEFQDLKAELKVWEIIRGIYIYIYREREREREDTAL